MAVGMAIVAAARARVNLRMFRPPKQGTVGEETSRRCGLLHEPKTT
jgi:hypothetical protein